MNSYPVSDSWQSPIDMSYDWNMTTTQSPKGMVTQYNDLLQRASDFYATLDNSYDSMSASGSDRSYRTSPDRNGSVSSSGNMVAQVRKSIPDKIERRREQNRSSQRAYRERKERHQRELEGQIADWQRKHSQLSRSFTQQTSEVQRLKSQIEHLTGEISALQTGLPSLYGGHSPAEFDLVPFCSNDRSPSSPRMPYSHAQR